MSYLFIMKTSFTVFKTLTAFIFIWFIIHSLYIIIDGMHDNGRKADIAVILGSKVNEDGTLSRRLEKRLEAGIDLYTKRRVKMILVSGGLGKEGFYEGDTMKEFLIRKQIPDSVIVVDNYGNNTEATVVNTLKLHRQLHYKSIIVVSQYFHVTRTKRLFRERGYTNVSSISPDYFEWRDLYSIIREFPAFYWE